MSRLHSIAAVRTQVEAHLTGRTSTAFVGHVRPAMPTLPTGIEDIDRQIGGIPLGAITEPVARRYTSSGQKSLQAQLLAHATRERVCALVDATDWFDPKSAQSMGVNLQRLLWVRCGGREMKALEQAFKCADLLLQGSAGFGVIILDLAGSSPRYVRKIPLTTWFRFRGVIQKQETALVVSTPCSVTSTCSELTLMLSAEHVRWSQTIDRGAAHTRVLAGFDFEADIARKRAFKKPVQPASHRLLAYPRLA
ncbi:MAG: hypothetical protein ACJ74Z_01115 [Bryobacteraceae bacterium]